MDQIIGIGPHSQVQLLIRRPPVRVPVDCSVGFAARVMREANVSAALIGDCDAIVTERDLARALASGLGPEADLSAVWVADPTTIAATKSVVEAAADMLHQEIRHLVVIGHGDALGVVSLRDVMAVLLQTLDPAVWVATLRESLTIHTEMWLG